ncbi:MAG TPA: hypothetical protein VF069_17960 [Streptosporangiaceae bacterium]
MLTRGMHLIGGELVACSDPAAPAAGGQALRELVERAVPPSAHVLVAGPHRADLVDRLAERQAKVTCLVRSRPDAEELARRYADTAAPVTILCGALDKLSRDLTGSYDAIIAAGGLGRLGTPDGSPLTWAERLARLTDLLAPGGTLVLGVENELGVHRLVAAEAPGPTEPYGPYDSPEPYEPPGGVRGTGQEPVPAGPGELATALAGLAVDRCYAAYPDPALPTVLLPAELLDRRQDPHELPALLISAALSGDPGPGERDRPPVLADPRRLTASALARGLGAALAPGWIVVARRGLVAGELPLALGADAAGAARWSALWELQRDEGQHGLPGGAGWRRTAVRPRGVMACGRVTRDPARLAGAVPPGRSFDELLLAACARADLPGLRGLLGSYARWLADGAAAGGDGPDRLPGHLVFADTTNVVVDGDRRFALLDPSWELAEPVPFRTALARTLRRFALRLVSEGHPHPWPSTLDLDGIALTLLAMAGHPGDRGLLGEAVRLEAEIVAAREGLPGHEEARLIAELEHGVPCRPPSHRDALRAARKLADDLRQERGRAEWLDDRLREAEATIAKRQAEVRALRRSASFRVGRMITCPVRLARRAARRRRRHGRAAT